MSGIGPVLTEGAEALLRQVHPNFVQGDRLTSQVFEATPKDEGLLSVHRGSKTTAREAFERFLARQFKTCGVVAVTVAEVIGAHLAAHDDPQVDDPAHAVINFNGKEEGEARRARKKLALAAQTRGWRHRPAA